MPLVFRLWVARPGRLMIGPSMKEHPLGTFGLGLSYGLPAGVGAAALLVLISDKPDFAFVSWAGILVAVVVAMVVKRRIDRRDRN